MVGKRPLRHVVAFPAQHVETFDPSGDAAKRGGEIWNDWPDGYPRAGLLFHGDNKEVLAHLLANGFRGKVNLIYIDPPFDSGADYVRKVSLRGAKGIVKLDGKGYTRKILRLALSRLTFGVTCCPIKNSERNW